MEIESHTERIKKEYESCLDKHDINSPEAAHWIGREKTWLRFKILTEIDDLNCKRILDFGCGNALLLDFLKEKCINCIYYGWDISEKMIAAAKSRHPNGTFRVIDVLKDDLEYFKGFFDYILVSGVFYIKLDANDVVHREWLQSILLKLWKLCKKGISVNFMTEFVEWRDPTLYYCPIGDIISFSVNNLSRWIIIRHDYQLWEFTLYIYKEPRERP